MLMKKNAFIIMTFIGLAFFSCETKSLEEEINDYCACKNLADKGQRNTEECVDILSSLVDKYQFDPEATEKLLSQISDCSKN